MSDHIEVTSSATAEHEPVTSVTSGGSATVSSGSGAAAESIVSGGTAEPLPANPAAVLDLTPYEPVQPEMAGQITEVAAGGCYVRTASGTAVLLPYTKAMIDSSYKPKVGDFWVVYGNGYQFISPRETFVTGHSTDVASGTVEPAVDPNAEPTFPHFLRFVTGSPEVLEAWIKDWVTWFSKNPPASVTSKPSSIAA